MTSRLRRAAHILHQEGWRQLTRRGARQLYRRLELDSLDFPLLAPDIADSRTVAPAVPPPPLPAGTPLHIGWLSTPPGIGSGGHTTMFRMITALEGAGHRCTLYLYDRYGGQLRDQQDTIRRGWPEVRAEVRSVSDGLRNLNVCVATSWPTAHVLARHPAPASHLTYFVQDFEPFFSAHGSEYELALDTYRMGLRCIALGQMVHDRLTSVGVESEIVDFGCDTDTYHSTDDGGPRRGVVFYARPGVARRGFLLGLLALKRFHSRHPDVPIHIYGMNLRDPGVPATQHGTLSPTELNALYNTVVAGLAMSFTNVSLVAEEMLAAGVIPVINDSADSRADLVNPWVSWAPPTPSGFADALSALVDAPDQEQRARAASASVRGRTWSTSGDQIVDLIEGLAWSGPPIALTPCQPDPLLHATIGPAT